MKKLQIGGLITSFNGKPLVSPDGQAVTVKECMISALGMHVSKDPKEAIEAMAVGLKVYDAVEEIDLEDAEYSLLKRICSINPCNHTLFVYSALMKCFDE